MRIERRFNGPADSANGGITCGLLVEALNGELLLAESAGPRAPMVWAPPPVPSGTA